ncbi:MAG TPA: DUF6677 family protein [Thermoanaerobaculia bacterium]|nr:DUF6677 family protein [Thermoanaerobaculia bacterium]
MTTKSTAATARTDSGALALLCLVAWAVPGAGHLWLGRRQKGVVFLAALLVMFVLGLWLEGRIFPLALSEPLVALAAIANFGVGVPWLLARMLDLGGGTVTAVTYEYGNCFLIVAGLLNFLVMLDAYDIATGRK